MDRCRSYHDERFTDDIYHLRIWINVVAEGSPIMGQI